MPLFLIMPFIFTHNLVSPSGHTLRERSSLTPENDYPRGDQSLPQNCDTSRKRSCGGPITQHMLGRRDGRTLPVLARVRFGGILGIPVTLPSVVVAAYVRELVLFGMPCGSWPASPSRSLDRPSKRCGSE